MSWLSFVVSMSRIEGADLIVHANPAGSIFSSAVVSGSGARQSVRRTHQWIAACTASRRDVAARHSRSLMPSGLAGGGATETLGLSPTDATAGPRHIPGLHWGSSRLPSGDRERSLETGVRQRVSRSADRPVTCGDLVARGGVEPPTFRFSGA